MRSEVREYVVKTRRSAKLNKDGQAVLVVDTQKVGMVVAIARGDKSFAIGWSLCDTTNDKFNASEAYDKAFGRARSKQETPMPHTISRYVRETDFVKRAKYELSNRSLLKRPIKKCSSKADVVCDKMTKNVKTMFKRFQVA